MDFAAIRSEHIKRTIDENPVSVTITRTTKVKDKGGFRQEQSTLGPYTVRVHQGSGGVAKTFDKVGGRKHEDAAWGLLAGPEADIRADELTLDTFEAPSIGKFEVTSVTPQVVKGTLCGLQAELKKVN